MENLTTRDNQEAVGLLEVFGLVCAFLAADAGCKAANVHLQVFDKNKPANADALPVPLLVTIKFRGSIADVEEAMRSRSGSYRYCIQIYYSKTYSGHRENVDGQRT